MTLGISTFRPVLATAQEEEALVGLAAQPTSPDALGGHAGLASEVFSLLRYMSQTEVHTYAFSVAANAILSLFPFIVMMFTMARVVFHSCCHGECDRRHDPLLLTRRPTIRHQEYGDCGQCARQESSSRLC